MDTHRTSHATVAERLHALLDGKLEGSLRTDEASRSLFSTDASIYLRRPEAAVAARCEEDVRRTLEAARELGLAITPRGTGTSLAGQATAPGLALDVSGMDRIVELDAENGNAGYGRCVVEPGVIQAELNARAAPHGHLSGRTGDRAGPRPGRVGNGPHNRVGRRKSALRRRAGSDTGRA